MVNGPQKALGKAAVYDQSPREWVKPQREGDIDYTDPLSSVRALSLGVRDANRIA